MTIILEQQGAKRFLAGDDWIRIGKGVTFWGEVTFIPRYTPGDCTLPGEPIPIKIGDGCILQHGAVLYSGVTLRDKVRVCHNSVVRENTFIGKHSVIGNLVMIEGNAVIGDHAIVNSQTHVTAYTKIHPYAFLSASITMTNDKYIKWYQEGHGEDLEGPIIHSRARIGSGVGIMGGISIGHGSLIGAGALVTKDVPDYEIWTGIPAKHVKVIDWWKEQAKNRFCHTCPALNTDILQEYLLGTISKERYEVLKDG